MLYQPPRRHQESHAIFAQTLLVCVFSLISSLVSIIYSQVWFGMYANRLSNTQMNCLYAYQIFWCLQFVGTFYYVYKHDFLNLIYLPTALNQILIVILDGVSTGWFDEKVSGADIVCSVFAWICLISYICVLFCSQGPAQPLDPARYLVRVNPSAPGT